MQKFVNIKLTVQTLLAKQREMSKRIPETVTIMIADMTTEMTVAENGTIHETISA